MNAVIYARYSSEMQKAESIDAQVRACRDYAAGKGIVISKVYADEAVSGKGSKTASRTQYQKMLKDAEKGLFDTVLIHKYDRVARNVGEHVNLELRLSVWSIKLIAVAQDFGSSKEAKIMKTMMWALSEYYIDALSDEVKKGHKEVALKGLHNGGYPPFGYDVVDQVYVINETEARYVRLMFRCAVNREGFTFLIKEMVTDGVTGKRGKPIKYPQIYEILRNEKYTGVYTYSPQEEKDRGLRRSKPNSIRIENALPAIVDKALFQEVQIIMNERKQTGAKAGYLCSGLVYCGNCGAKMHGSTTSRKGHRYRIYTCSSKCGIGTISMDDVDETVTTYLAELFSDKNMDAVNRALWSYMHDQKRRVAEFNASVGEQIGEKQQHIDNYMNTLASGALPNELIADIGNKIVRLKNEIRNLTELPAPRDFSIAQIGTWLESLRGSADERSTIELLIERIDATKTAINVTSTLTAVLGETGCGGRI